MKVWVVIIKERHFDTDAEVFTAPEAAVEYARALLADRLDPALAAGDDELGEQETPDGWLFFGRWSHEGDCVWVAAAGKETDPIYGPQS